MKKVLGKSVKLGVNYIIYSVSNSITLHYQGNYKQIESWLKTNNQKGLKLEAISNLRKMYGKTLVDSIYKQFTNKNKELYVYSNGICDEGGIKIEYIGTNASEYIEKSAIKKYLKVADLKTLNKFGEEYIKDKISKYKGVQDKAFINPDDFFEND